MAKLDKRQQNYAIDRIDRMTSAAIAVLRPIEDTVSDNEVRAMLEKKGFVVTCRYSIASYVQPAKTAKQQAAINKRAEATKAKEVEIRQAASAAKDKIMLGDSAEVTQILADLAKKFGV